MKQINGDCMLAVCRAAEQAMYGKTFAMIVIDSDGAEHEMEVQGTDLIDAASNAMQEARERCIRPAYAIGHEVAA